MEKTLSILAFCPYYPPHLGGLEKYAVELHRELALRGLLITVFTPRIPRNGKNIEEMVFGQGCVRILRFPAWEIIDGYPLPNLINPLFWRVWKELRIQHYDLVVSYTRFFSTTLMAAMFALYWTIPYVHVEHGSNHVVAKKRLVEYAAYLYDNIFGRLIFKLASVNVSPSLSAQNFIRHFDDRPSPLIYRGLPDETWEKVIPEKLALVKRNGQVVITYAGRFIAAKGVIDLIKAAAALPDDKYILLLIGAGSQEKELKNLVAKLGLTANVNFPGQKTEKQIISYLKASDIVVNPSYSEGLPTVVLEACAMGKAVVATNVGGTEEIVIPGESGLTYQPGDIQSLVKHLMALMKDRKKRLVLGNRARMEVARKFNWQNASQLYVGIFDELIYQQSKRGNKRL